MTKQLLIEKVAQLYVHPAKMTLESGLREIERFFKSKKGLQYNIKRKRIYPEQIVVGGFSRLVRGTELRVELPEGSHVPRDRLFRKSGCAVRLTGTLRLRCSHSCCLPCTFQWPVKKRIARKGYVLAGDETDSRESIPISRDTYTRMDYNRPIINKRGVIRACALE